MIVVRIKGGLGNQMYGYSLYRAFKERGYHVKMDISFYKLIYGSQKGNECLRNFGLERFFHLKGDYLNIFEELFYKAGKKLGFIDAFIDREQGFQPEVFDIRKGLVDGYWQSFKYISGLESKIRKAFGFHIDITEDDSNLLKMIDETESVSVHVRRSDYLSGGVSLPFGYYKRALAYMRSCLKQPQFFVVSDDISWCKENFIEDDVVLVDSNKKDECFDMYLMTRCKNNIMANSTYSAWGSFLNMNQNRIVIRPDRWIPGDKNDRKDFWLDDWIPVAVSDD